MSKYRVSFMLLGCLLAVPIYAQDTPLFSPGEAAPATAQPGGQEAYPPNTAPSTDAPPAESDPTLTTRETAVECATAQIVQKAGERRASLANPSLEAYKAGLCLGKIQTYMLSAAKANPSCFPKISLEEGMAIFVKWSDAHTDQLTGDYPEGFRLAFEDAIPCLKK